MSAREARDGGTTVVLCFCPGKAGADAAGALESRLVFSGLPKERILRLEAACGASGLHAVADFASRRGAGSLVCAGSACCSPAAGRALLDSLAASCGLTPSAVRGVELSGSAEPDAREIRKALAASAATPRFQSRAVALDQTVLVVGSGEAARLAEARLAELGHPVARPEGTVEGLDGHVGEFRACVRSAAGRRSVACGAVLVAEDPVSPPAAVAEIGRRWASARVVALAALEAVAAALPREPRVRPVGIVLDLDTEESRAGSEAALEAARRMQRAGATQVYLFAHDLRVAAPGLQELYDAVREGGVTIVKYDGRLEITSDASGARLSCRDAGLGGEATYACDLVGVSPWGVLPRQGAGPDFRGLAEALGVNCDPCGRLQENNIHLLPVLTSRAGVFVAGPARGQHYAPDALQEVEAAAAAAHALLAPRSLHVELSHAVVDEDKCALCLTCVRSCPHRAMGIDAEKKVAAADPVACRKCGICAGECPAKAITLPAWSDEGILAQLGRAP